MLAIALQPILLNVLAGLLWFVVLAWLISIALTLYGISRQKTLSPIDDLGLQANDAPLVSVLIPARNEEHRVLADCIRSILDQDYACFEIIAVDDRSTDATGVILEALAKGDSRLRVIEGEEPPAGWLGKTYAMHQAFSHARGEWILATDADMIFERSALRTAVAMTLEREADAMTLIPYFEAKSFWERVMIPTYAWVLLVFTVSYRVDNPKSRRAVGIGGFFLMRRAVLERAGGYEALKDEVLEDVRLAELIKHSGGSLLAEYAPSLLRTRMYRNFEEMWECCTKNWFAGMNFSVPLAMWCVFSMYLIAVVPPLMALASAIGILSSVNTDLWRLFIPAVASWLMQVLILLIVSSRSGVNPSYALTAPLGLGLLYAMLFDSTIRITRGKGVRWKGRRIYERAGVCVPKLRNAASRFSKGQKKEGMPG